MESSLREKARTIRLEAGKSISRRFITAKRSSGVVFPFKSSRDNVTANCAPSLLIMIVDGGT